MPFSQKILFVSFLLIAIPVFSQKQAAQWKPIFVDQTPQTPTPAIKDDKAIEILNRSLVVAGGAAGLKAITDYTARGQITYASSPDAKSQVTLTGRHLTSVRIDANLPAGTRSWSVSNGQSTSRQPDGKIEQMSTTRASVPTSDAFPYKTPLFPGALGIPYKVFKTVIDAPTFALSYKGISKIGDRSVYDVQAVRQMSANSNPKNAHDSANRIDFYIDSTSFQLVMTEDVVPKNTIHRMHYGDYRVVNNVLVPFSISEETGAQPTWTITVREIVFNSGLSDGSFDLR